MARLHRLILLSVLTVFVGGSTVLAAFSGNPPVETFDGNPATPLAFSDADWDVQVHSRDPGTWLQLESINAQHGSDCSAPPVSHPNTSYEGSVFICKDHQPPDQATLSGCGPRRGYHRQPRHRGLPGRMGGALMPVSAARVADVTGVLYQVETDVDSGVELRRFRLPADQQTPKVRLEALLDESADDLARLQWRIDHLDDYGLGPAAKAVMLNALTARKAFALTRDLQLLQAWRAL